VQLRDSSELTDLGGICPRNHEAELHRAIIALHDATP
jgi:hypothetical protein